MDGNSQTLSLLCARGGQWSTSALVVASIVFAVAIGVFLVSRRVVGALVGPVPVMELLCTAIGVAVWAVLVCAVATKPQAALWVVLGVLIVFAVGCSYPGHRILDWFVWLTAGAIIFAPPAVTRAKKGSLFQRRSVPADGRASDDRVLQQFSRVRTADGKDTISGTLVAEFAAGERQATVYASFCPPYEEMPQVEVNVADDFDAEVKLVQVLHNGAQIDVRLSEPAEEPVAVTVEFVATESA